MKKALITALAVVSAAFVYGGVRMATVETVADTSVNQITFSETKLNVATNGDKMLVVTAINDAENIGYVSEIGYTIDGYTVGENDFAPVDTYYETITLGENGTPKTAQDLGFTGATETSKLLIWEIAYNAETTYGITAYAIHEGDADKTVTGDKKTNEFTVSFELDGVTVEPQTVNYGETAVAPTVGGYDVAWTLNGEAYDFTQPVTKNITLVGTKTEKVIDLNAKSYLYYTGDGSRAEVIFDTTNGRTGFEPTYNVTYEGYLGLNLTSADIAYYKAQGKNTLTFNLVIWFSNGSFNEQTVFGQNVKSMQSGSKVPVSVSLDNLSDYIDGKLPKTTIKPTPYTGAIYFHDFALTTIYTVTYELDGATYATKTLGANETAENLAIGGYDVVWKLNGEAYDFTQPVTGDIKLVGEKGAERVIELNANSYLNSSSRGDEAIVYKNGGMGWDTFNINYTAYLGVSLTSADIEYYKAQGKTAFTFNLKVWFTAGGEYKATVFGQTVSITGSGNQAAVSVPLDDLIPYADGKLVATSINATPYNGGIYFIGFALA
ncbi:MAG: InlB B-repeat-containing protein [Clostridia bacterium]|nr:InlB B-repeat-containing protein [Clostridia bacterium]